MNLGAASLTPTSLIKLSTNEPLRLWSFPGKKFSSEGEDRGKNVGYSPRGVNFQSGTFLGESIPGGFSFGGMGGDVVFGRFVYLFWLVIYCFNLAKFSQCCYTSVLFPLHRNFL